MTPAKLDAKPPETDPDTLVDEPTVDLYDSAEEADADFDMHPDLQMQVSLLACSDVQPVLQRIPLT